MAACRVDSDIGDDQATVIESSIRYSKDLSGNQMSIGDPRKTGKKDLHEQRSGKNEDDGMESLGIIEDHERTSSDTSWLDHGAKRIPQDLFNEIKSLVGQDKADKNRGVIEPADKPKTFDTNTADLAISVDDACEFRSPDRQCRCVVFTPDNAIQNKTSESREPRRNQGNSEVSIPARVIYKLVGSSKCRGSGDTYVKKDQREDSPRLCVHAQQPRNHVNLILDTVDGSARGFGTSQTEVPRKLVDSLKDSAARSAVKQREDVAEKSVPRTSTNQETGLVGGPGSSNDAAPIRRARTQMKQAKCENCEDAHHSHERHPYSQKCPGDVDREGVAGGERDTCGPGGTESKQEIPVNTLLYHSASLPRLSVHDSGVACSGNEQTPAVGQAHSTKQLVADLKQLHTLRQHYYPEGGWGWVVVVVGVLVQVLSHGIHGANGVLLQQIAEVFGAHAYLESG